MSDLIQQVKNGKVIEKTTDSTSTRKSNDLDKNAFLQLLVTQMKYQDPLNPNTDTEYIAQLATFSQLEQLQNLGSISTNTMAFSLVGKEVVVRAESASGNISYVQGRVDYVTMSGNKTMLSINGSLYSIDQLDSVISNEFILEQNLPGVVNKVELVYDAEEPEDKSFEVKLGTGDTVADNVAIIIDNKVIDSKLVQLKDNKVTIRKEAFAGLENGVYKLVVVFNDVYYTTVTDKVTLKVQNAQPARNDDTDPANNEKPADDVNQTEPADTNDTTNTGTSGTDGESEDNVN